MMFSLSGIGEKGEEVFLTVDASDQGFVFKFSNESEELGLDLREGCEIIRKYNNNYGGGSPYYLRPYYKKFSDCIKLNTVQENLVRAFAVSSSYIQFWYTNEYGLHKSKLSFYKEFDECLNDQILFDWTGDMDVQPQMYYLPIQLTKENMKEEKLTPEINELYNFGLLQRLNSKGEINFTNFYVPLIIPDIDMVSKQFKNNKTIRLWKIIVSGINNEIRRLVSNNSNWKA